MDQKTPDLREQLARANRLSATHGGIIEVTFGFGNDPGRNGVIAKFQPDHYNEPVEDAWQFESAYSEGDLASELADVLDELERKIAPWKLADSETDPV